MFAKDYRQSAWKKLDKKWGVAILSFLVYSLIYGAVSSFTGIGGLIVGGPLFVGYTAVLMTIVRGGEAKIDQVFENFSGRFVSNMATFLLYNVYIWLWSLLFFIPGIVKSYSYAMTFYILNDNPEMGANEAITRSRQIMDGNKWRLFCLGFSFIGWSLLCSLPTLIALGAILGMAYRGQSLAVLLWLIPASIPSFIGYLFLRPYQEAAYAAFYRDVSGTEAYTVLLDSEDDYTV